MTTWDDAFQTASDRLIAEGLQTEWYALRGVTGYAAVMEAGQTDVHCLEACLGASHRHRDYRSYAMAQVFDPSYPNMAMVTMIARRIDDGALAPMSQVVYSPKLDKAFSSQFLPILHSAFNCLDPCRRNRSVLVQSYNAKLTFSDLWPATVATFRLMRRFKADGQLAQIAVDFDDPWIKSIAAAADRFSRGRDIVNIPRTNEASLVNIPLRGPDGAPCEIRESSSALEQGIQLARKRLDAHYARTALNDEGLESSDHSPSS